MRAGEPLILGDWTFNHLADLWQRVVEHLVLTGIAVGVGFVLAALLAVAIREWPALYGPVTFVSGLRGVPPDVREAAIGMGYSRWRMLWEIELPLALVVIIAGLRVAVVTTIGLVTVTSLIGQGGLGFLILQGIQQFFSTPLIIGAVLSIALAVILDGMLVVVQRLATPWLRRAV